MAGKAVAIRLGTEGKAEVKRDLREIGEAGQQGFRAVGDAAEREAQRAQRAFDRASSDIEAAQQRARGVGRHSVRDHAPPHPRSERGRLPQHVGQRQEGQDHVGALAAQPREQRPGNAKIAGCTRPIGRQQHFVRVVRRIHRHLFVQKQHLRVVPAVAQPPREAQGRDLGAR